MMEEIWKKTGQVILRQQQIAFMMGSGTPFVDVSQIEESYEKARERVGDMVATPGRHASSVGDRRTLDLATVASRRLEPPNAKRRSIMQVFQVQGMSCALCVRAITQALQAADASAVVEVDLAAGEVRVASTLSNEQIAALIVAEGYEASARN